MTLLALPLALGLTGPAALAGYGDVQGGYPSADERALHLWTNAARVDPGAFQAYYDCSMDNWQAYETQSQAPIPMDYDLVEAARYHSEDMRDNNHWGHDSSDGTSFAARMARFYDSGFVGENIASGYYDEFDAVFGGWMCSDGHRANIMLPDWAELGTGVAGTFYTQDFGGGTPDSAEPVVMGTHWPMDALAEAEFYADWFDAAAPTRLVVVVDGRAEPMEVEYGAAEMGVYRALVEHDNAGCHAYFFAWETAGGDKGRFPEEGSYLYGDGCTDAHGEQAAADMWMMGQEGSLGGGAGGTGDESGTWGGEGGTSYEADDIKLVGCAAAPAPAGLGLALLGLGLAVRRREG